MKHPINTTFKECSGLHGVARGPWLLVAHGMSEFDLTPHDKRVVNLDEYFTLWGETEGKDHLGYFLKHVCVKMVSLQITMFG